MPTASVESRLTALEKDSILVHQAIFELNVRLDVIEQRLESGFTSIENRLIQLQEWLAERL